MLILLSAFYITVSIPSYTKKTKIIKNVYLENSLDKLMKEYGIVGCSLTVIKNKNNVFDYNYGFANIETKEKMFNSHSIRLASISKLLTAILLLNVTEKDPAILDKPISKQIDMQFTNPYFQNEKITLKELLTHTSSFSPKDITSEEFIKESIANPKLNISEIISNKGKFYKDFYWDDAYPPGNRYSYSGYNFLLIATIIEKLTNQRFNQVAHTTLINKLGLNNTHLATSLPFAETKYAVGYSFKNDIPEVTIDDNKFRLRITNKNYVIGRNPTIHSPQSGFRSNIIDLSKIMKMLMNNGEYEKTRILKKESVKLLENAEFKTSGTVHRGLGSEINYQLIPNIKMIGHSGNAYGILTHFFYNREQDFGIIFIINGMKMLAYEENGDHLLIEREIPKLIYDSLININKNACPTSSAQQTS